MTKPFDNNTYTFKLDDFTENALIKEIDKRGILVEDPRCPAAWVAALNNDMEYINNFNARVKEINDKKLADPDIDESIIYAMHADFKRQIESNIYQLTVVIPRYILENEEHDKLEKDDLLREAIKTEYIDHGNEEIVIYDLNKDF